jgi:hypothetical protein
MTVEKSFSYKWVVIIFFGVVGIAFTASVIYLAAGNVAPDTYWGRKWTLPKSTDDAPPPVPSKYVLELNRATRIGDRVFYFRGRRGDQMLLEVIIPEIDRKYAYPFRVGLKEAKNGVNVAGIRFNLLIIRPTFAKLEISR